MDRRAFLRRAIGGTAVVTASVSCGWSLATLKNWLEKLFHAPESAYPAWSAALHDTHGGRFTSVKLRKLQDRIWNESGRTFDEILNSPGVENDYRLWNVGLLDALTSTSLQRI